MTSLRPPNPHQLPPHDITWLIPLGYTDTILDRLNGKLVRSTGNCLVWTGERDHFGHGRIHKGGPRHSGKTMTHRLVWMLTHQQEIPAGMQINHHCDNPPCCEPTHIYLGTAADNTADMLRRGRTNPATGENSGRARFTDEQVRQMRADYIELDSYSAVARKYDTDASYVRQVVLHKIRRDA